MAYFRKLFDSNQNTVFPSALDNRMQPMQLDKSQGAAGMSSSPGGQFGSASSTMATDPTRSGMNFVNSQRYFDQNPNQEIGSKVLKKASDRYSSETSNNASLNAGIAKYANDFTPGTNPDEKYVNNAIGGLKYNKDSPQYKDAYAYLSGILNVDYKDPGTASWTPSEGFVKDKDLFGSAVKNDAGKNNLIKSFSTDPSRYTGGEMALDRLLYGSDSQANNSLAQADSLMKSAGDNIESKNKSINSILADKKQKDQAKASFAKSMLTKIFDANKDTVGGGSSVWNVGDGGAGHNSPFDGVYTDQYSDNGMNRNEVLDQYRSLAKLLGLDPGTVKVNPNIAAAEPVMSGADQEALDKKMQEEDDKAFRDWLSKHPQAGGRINRAQGNNSRGGGLSQWQDIL